jgi:Zn-dependent metalloprotease
MAGEAAKYFARPNMSPRNDFLVGADIMKNGTALRYFADPTLDGRSIGNANDYYDGLDVHYSSGVFNKAFYTLATKANWNTEKAFRTFVLANQIYWNANSDYVDAGCGVKKAAKDLNYNIKDVMDAFNVVGVNASCHA